MNLALLKEKKVFEKVETHKEESEITIWKRGDETMVDLHKHELQKKKEKKKKRMWCSIPKTGESRIVRDTIPEGVNSHCPISLSKNATRLYLFCLFVVRK
jgi:hypothetical protein